MSDNDRFYDDVDTLLDEWFARGEFSGMTPQRTVAWLLMGEYPHLTEDGARALVRVWFDCARDMGEID